MQRYLTPALLLAAGMVLAALGYAQQTPATSTPAATTPAAPAATTPKAATTAKKPGTATKKVAQGTQQPGLLSSKELLVLEAKDLEFKGTISVTAGDTDCRSVKFNIDVTHTSDTGRFGQREQFDVFYPGITFSFVGHSCIPAKAAQFSAKYDVNVKPEPGGGMALSEGRIVSTGPMIVSGTVSVATPQRYPVIDFTSSPADPLVFHLTRDGYHYISGIGTVRLPSGGVYTWTTSGGDAEMNQAAIAAKTAAAATTAKAPATKTGTAANSAAPAPLKTKTEEFSYALGMNIGSNLGNSLKNQSVEVDWNLVSQGLKDSTSGGKTRLTEDEAKAVLTEVQNEVNKQRQEKMQQAAAANKTEGEAFLAANKSKEGVVTLPSGLQYKILTAGAGPKPTATDSVECNYRGTLINGTEFDSSYKRGKPVTFPVSGVIKGWTEALQLMTVGSKWQLFIPSSLAYAERGAGAEIGPNATLIFEVELLSIVSKNADTAPSESSQKKTYTLNSSSVFRGPNGEMLVPVEGQMLLDKGLLLTGGKVGEVGSNSIQIAGHTFQVVEATKICGADGKRAKLSSFKLGDNAAVTSALDEKDALTLRNGLAFLGTGTDKSQKPQKYECE